MYTEAHSRRRKNRGDLNMNSLQKKKRKRLIAPLKILLLLRLFVLRPPNESSRYSVWTRTVELQQIGNVISVYTLYSRVRTFIYALAYKRESYQINANEKTNK